MLFEAVTAGIGGPIKGYIANGITQYDDFEFINKALAALHSPEIFTLPNGVNEFDLHYVDGTYHLFYDTKSGSSHRAASTIGGLSSATDDLSHNGRYPSAFFDGTTWHLWSGNGATAVTSHYTAPAASGPYTLSDTIASTFMDVSVRRGPDGMYYAAYKRTTTNKIGVLKSASLAGPWTDLGYVFADLGRAAWHLSEEADPHIIWLGTRAYILFAGWDGSQQRVGVVEVNATTMRAISPSVVLVNPLEPWQQRNSQLKVFSPIYLHTDKDGAAVYYSQNPSASGIVTGWARLVIGDSERGHRRRSDAMRYDAAIGRVDLGTNIPLITHGAAIAGPSGLSCPSAPSGAYGHLGVATLSDFTIEVEFTATSLPTGGNFARLIRASTLNAGANPIVSIWINGASKLYVEVNKNDGVGNLAITGITTLQTGVRYVVKLRKCGTDVTLTLNGVVEVNGSHTGPLTGLREWSVANAKGASTAADQQFLGTIHKAAIMAEAQPRIFL